MLRNNLSSFARLNFQNDPFPFPDELAKQCSNGISSCMVRKINTTFRLLLKVSFVFLSIQSQHGVYLISTLQALAQCYTCRWNPNGKFKMDWEETTFKTKRAAMTFEAWYSDYTCAAINYHIWGRIYGPFAPLETWTFKGKYCVSKQKENHLLHWWLYNHITHCELFKDS